MSNHQGITNVVDMRWGKHPMRVTQSAKAPFDYQIFDADGNQIHHEMPVSSSTDWKTIQDMLDVRGIKDGTCGLTREEWQAQIFQQRRKLRFMAQVDEIEVI